MGASSMIKFDDVFDDLSRIGIDTSPCTACTSVITVTEVLVVPFKRSEQKLAEDYKNVLFNGINFHTQSINPEIAETAARIRAKYNLRTPDALQIATALESNCQAFLCNDRAFERVTDLRIILLDELEL
jgi:predicted nucleic acid-binding protein